MVGGDGLACRPLQPELAKSFQKVLEAFFQLRNLLGKSFFGLLYLAFGVFLGFLKSLLDCFFSFVDSLFSSLG